MIPSSCRANMHLNPCDQGFFKVNNAKAHVKAIKFLVEK